MRKTTTFVTLFACLATISCMGPSLSDAQKDEVADIAADSSFDPEELQSRLDDLQTQLEETASKNIQMESEIASLRSEVANLQSEVSNLQSQVGY